jgi:hypothetical protein
MLTLFISIFHDNALGYFSLLYVLLKKLNVGKNIKCFGAKDDNVRIRTTRYRVDAGIFPNLLNFAILSKSLL